MIITQLKKIGEIYSFIKNYSKILVVGCDGCCQPPRSINEAKVLAQMLELKARSEGKELKWKAITILRQCDDRIAATSIRPFLEDYEAIVSLACGLGVNMMNRIAPDILTFPAQNSMFEGVMNQGENSFIQYCETCGTCILGVTGGICPIAGCAKHLYNGPCGGTVNGKCEVGGYSIPCAWIEIYRRLKKFNRVDLFAQYRPARNYRSATSPGYIPLNIPATNEPEKNKEEKK